MQKHNLLLPYFYIARMAYCPFMPFPEVSIAHKREFGATPQGEPIAGRCCIGKTAMMYFPTKKSVYFVCHNKIMCNFALSEH